MTETYFLDTSALVKRYHVEAGTARLDTVFAEPDATFIIASITIAEFTSAIALKQEQREISREALLHTLSKFSEDLIAEFWVLDIERHHIHQAQELILRYRLRTLDSLQLSLLLVTKALSPIFFARTGVCSPLQRRRASASRIPPQSREMPPISLPWTTSNL